MLKIYRFIKEQSFPTIKNRFNIKHIKQYLDRKLIFIGYLVKTTLFDLKDLIHTVNIENRVERWGWYSL